MSLFKQLFGKSERKRSLEEGEKESADSGKISKVFVCAKCGKEGYMDYSKEKGYKLAMFIDWGKLLEVSKYRKKPAELFKLSSAELSKHRFIGVCPKEMIYVCSWCAKWVMVKPDDNDILSRDIKEEIDTDRRELLEKLLEVRSWQPNCPNCGAPLEGKTSADLKFISDSEENIPRLLHSGKPEECKQLCLKLLRILEEEEEFLIENGMDKQVIEDDFRNIKNIKASADLMFYNDNVRNVLSLLHSGKREECKQLCLKLLRILEEEKECFIERGIMSEQDFERRFHALEEVLSNLWDHESKHLSITTSY